jgi:hypothetical protein
MVLGTVSMDLEVLGELRFVFKSQLHCFLAEWLWERDNFVKPLFALLQERDNYVSGLLGYGED